MSQRGLGQQAARGVRAQPTNDSVLILQCVSGFAGSTITGNRVQLSHRGCAHQIIVTYIHSAVR